MSIFDRLWNRKTDTPRVIEIQPGRLKIEARGCTIVIEERCADRLGRECTAISIDVPAGGGTYKLIAKPYGGFKDRHFTQTHVVKLKKPVVREMAESDT